MRDRIAGAWEAQSRSVATLPIPCLKSPPGTRRVVQVRRQKARKANFGDKGTMKVRQMVTPMKRTVEVGKAGLRGMEVGGNSGHHCKAKVGGNFRGQ